MKKYGGAYKMVQRSRLANIFTFYGIMSKENVKERIHPILKAFFIDYIEQQKVRGRMRERYHCLIAIKEKLTMKADRIRCMMKQITQKWNVMARQIEENS